MQRGFADAEGACLVASGSGRSTGKESPSPGRKRAARKARPSKEMLALPGEAR